MCHRSQQKKKNPPHAQASGFIICLFVPWLEGTTKSTQTDPEVLIHKMTVFFFSPTCLLHTQHYGLVTDQVLTLNVCESCLVPALTSLLTHVQMDLHTSFCPCVSLSLRHWCLHRLKINSVQQCEGCYGLLLEASGQDATESFTLVH